MELSFVVSAIKRRFWLVLACTLLGALPGLLSSPQSGDQFLSTATLLIEPPSSAGGQTVFVNDPDRYVLSQLSVLESFSLAGQVAEEIGGGLSAGAVASGISIEHLPETAIVNVVATFDDAELAQQVAQTHVRIYTQLLGTRIEQNRGPELANLDQRLDELSTRLNDLNTQIQEAMASFLPKQDSTNANNVPAVETVAPNLASEKVFVESQYSALLTTKNDLELTSRLRVNTQIVQDAELPTEAAASGGPVALVGGTLAGFMLGIVAALAWARFSSKVLDEMSVGQILGTPITAELPHYRTLARQPLAAFEALPRSAAEVVDQLCVRAESLAQVSEPLTVAVVGTRKSSGTTTLALALAERFANASSSVVLVDAHVRDPQMTSLFNAGNDGGIPAVIANEGAIVDQRGRSVFTRTIDSDVTVLGLGKSSGVSILRRDTINDVLEACKARAEVTVIDGGPILDSASTLHLCQLVDAVVLAVPLSRERGAVLSDLARQLGEAQRRLLPVITSPARRSARRFEDGTSIGTGPVSPLAPVNTSPRAPTAEDARLPMVDLTSQPPGPIPRTGKTRTRR